MIALGGSSVKDTRKLSEKFGVGVAIVSVSAGAGGAVATRYLVDAADPFTLAAIRFGGGFLCLLPAALALNVRWPSRSDWPAVAGLGFLFYAVFFVFYNVALGWTTVARGTLALSMLPLMTMLAGALLGVEPLGARKASGVVLAVSGVTLALSTSLAEAPAGAWRGDLIMAGATLCMALYTIWSRPFIQRSSSLGFLVAGMGVGAAFLAAGALALDGAEAITTFGAPQWAAAAYLAAGGGALAFFLWIQALRYASPTQVANAMTINPLVAGLAAAALLDEPVTPNMGVGLIAVGAGIFVATRRPRSAWAPGA